MYSSRWPYGQENVDPVGDDRAMRRSPMLAAALAAATAIALAAPAYADDNISDQQFLDALTKAGINYHSPGEAITEAKNVCSMLGKKSPFEVVNDLAKVNQGLSTSAAYEFTLISAGAYCPKEMQGGDKK